MKALQEVGVPAYPVKNTKELLTDSHMEARNFYERFVHPSESGIGTRAYVGRPWRMPEMPSVIHRPAPKLGEQNEHIISDLLGWSDEEVSRLYALDIMGKVPSNAFERKPVNLGAGVEEGTIAEIDPDFKETLRY
jgi:crotonobetainyl-CoA:carnitine CoA-transferase CaiB-like acyl-CoA transferase